MVRRLIEAFFSIPPLWVIGAVFLVPALETALLVGFVLPGESVLVLGGVLAARGRVGLWPVLAPSILGPMVGDVAGYWLGRRYGQEIVRSRLGRRWDRAHRWLSRKGGWSIFTARFLPFARTVLPSTAGAMRTRRLQFFAWDLPAVAVWAAGSCLLGYFAARNIERLLKQVSNAGLVLLGLAAVAAVVFFLVRSRQRVQRPRSRRKARLAMDGE